MFSPKNPKEENTLSTHNKIDQATEFVGDLISKTDIRIDGSFRGKVFTQGKLFAGKKGDFEGTARVDVLDVSGTIKGKFHVKNTLYLRVTAKAEGTFHVHNLMVEKGATLKGNCITNKVIKLDYDNPFEEKKASGDNTTAKNILVAEEGH